MSLRTHLSLLSIVSALSAVACTAQIEGDAPLVDEPGVEAQGGIGILGPGQITDVPPDPNAIPATGTLPPGLTEVDDAIKAFMRATCTGSVSIALGFGNAPIMARGYGYKSGPPNKSCARPGDPFVGGAKVTPNTAFRIGSNSKAITAAITRIVLKQKLASMGRPATDAELESLKVFDKDLDLVSPRLRAAVMGFVDGPNPSCVPGRTSPVTVSGLPDVRLRDVTVGHLLGHRAGFPREGNPVTSKLSRIRFIDSPSKLDAESAMVGAPGQARFDVGGRNNNGYFIRPATLEEYLIGNLDLCLERSPGAAPAPGDDAYSNIGFAFLQHIAEHVSGYPLAAPLGDPNGHDASLLGQFLKTRLGIYGGNDSVEGIYFSQPMEAFRDPSEPKYRGWDGATQNGQFWDTKRPWCSWTGSTCDGTAFDNGDRRYNWDWTKTKVGVSYSNEGTSSGVGLLAAEMPLYLRFMSKYWVSGSGSTPFYGRERASNPSGQTRWHIGELVGTHSTVAQFVGATVPYIVVPRKPNGELDLASFHDKLPMNACKLPAKLDLALATNQVNDADCTPSEGNICSVRYMALRDVVKEALCRVDWMKVNPQLSL